MKPSTALDAAYSRSLIDDLMKRFELKDIADLTAVPISTLRSIRYKNSSTIEPAHADALAALAKYPSGVHPVVEFAQSIRGQVFVAMCRAGAVVMIEERCFRGHLRNEENTAFDKSGKRRCRECQREAQIVRRERVARKIAQAAA